VHLRRQLFEREVRIVVGDMCGGHELSQVVEPFARFHEVGVHREQLRKLRGETMIAGELIGDCRPPGRIGFPLVVVGLPVVPAGRPAVSGRPAVAGLP
jgi:hypothetical protein